MNRSLSICLMLPLLLQNTHAHSQYNNWATVIVKPDLKVEFPSSPAVDSTNMEKWLYKLDLGHEIFIVTSEKNKISFKGRRVSEVNNEFFGSIINKTLAEENTRKLVSTREFDISGYKTVEIVFLQVVKGEEVKVTRWILWVSGYKDALYKISYWDFNKREELSLSAKHFFNSLNLYYSLEEKLKDPDSTNANKEILKKEGFNTTE